MILTSRNPERMISDEDCASADRYRAMVVREIKQYTGADELSSIKLCPKSELITLHHSLGAAIRAEYELWLNEHEVTSIWVKTRKQFPLNGETVDDHPCHPDNFSFSCIERLWEELQ